MHGCLIYYLPVYYPLPDLLPLPVSCLPSAFCLPVMPPHTSQLFTGAGVLTQRSGVPRICFPRTSHPSPLSQPGLCSAKPMSPVLGDGQQEGVWTCCFPDGGWEPKRKCSNHQLHHCYPEMLSGSGLSQLQVRRPYLCLTLRPKYIRWLLSPK